MKRVCAAAAWVMLMTGLGAAGSASAQATWNWGSGTPSCDPYTCTVGTPPNDVTATVSGWGAETAGSNFVKGSVNDVDPSGLGVMSKDASGSNENTNSPNHSIDNFKAYQNGNTSDSSTGGAVYAEVLAIEFTKAVSLTQVATAWTHSDSDAMIFRWDLGGTANLANVKASDLPTSGIGTAAGTKNGWTLVAAGQFSTTGSLSFTSALYSSYWLVSTALGQTNGDANNDGFKVVSFTGNVCSNGNCQPGQSSGVPEPGTLALAAAALLGGLGSRRRILRGER